MVATSGLRGIVLAATAAAALGLSACVESQTPLITDAKPLVGQQFEVHLYESFVDNKATNFHTAAYQWKDGQYVRASGLASDAKRFVAQPLAAGHFILQSSDDNGMRYVYWVARKLSDGTYLVIALDEMDADAATRKAACGTDQPEVCRVKTHDQLVMLAKATAAKPARDASLAVLLSK